MSLARGLLVVLSVKGVLNGWVPCRYILVYPQGCDVCNHLSLFLCVADYDKLLPGAQLPPHMKCCKALREQPARGLDVFGNSCAAQPAGWSHFAQFTIAVVNKDPKKSKYSGETSWLLSRNSIPEGSAFQCPVHACVSLQAAI